MSVKATLVDDDFTRLVRNLSRYTGTEFPKQMRQEAGLVALDCMRFTRPSGKGTVTQRRAEGEKSNCTGREPCGAGILA